MVAGVDIKGGDCDVVAGAWMVSLVFCRWMRGVVTDEGGGTIRK